MAKKATGLIIDDLERAEGALAEMAALDGKLALIELDLNEKLETARAGAVEAATPLNKRRKELEDALKSYAKRQQSVLFVDRQSKELAFGTIGYRNSRQLVQMDGVKADFTLQKLKALGLREGIQTSESLAKENMEKWPVERLELVGLHWKESTKYYVEVNKEKVQTQ
jgi:Bacteriophage Mu Gam like protein.